MKKLILIILALAALAGHGQISDVSTKDTIDFYIKTNASKSITAAQLNRILTHLNTNKLHKDSVDAVSIYQDTCIIIETAGVPDTICFSTAGVNYWDEADDTLTTDYNVRIDSSFYMNFGIAEVGYKIADSIESEPYPDYTPSTIIGLNQGDSLVGFINSRAYLNNNEGYWMMETEIKNGNTDNNKDYSSILMTANSSAENYMLFTTYSSGYDSTFIKIFPGEITLSASDQVNLNSVVLVGDTSRFTGKARFLNGINLLPGGQLSPGEEGDIFYNADEHTPYYHNGSDWTPFGSSGAEADPVWISDSSTYISKSQARGDIHDSIAGLDLGDDLGNHTMTTNLKTGTRWISSNGAENTGIGFGPTNLLKLTAPIWKGTSAPDYYLSMGRPSDSVVYKYPRYIAPSTKELSEDVGLNPGKVLEFRDYDTATETFSDAYLYINRMYYRGGAGDVDGDFDADITDGLRLTNYLYYGADPNYDIENPYEADVDGDGFLTMTDAELLSGFNTTYPTTYIDFEVDSVRYDSLKRTIGRFHSGLDGGKYFNVRAANGVKIDAMSAGWGQFTMADSTDDGYILRKKTIADIADSIKTLIDPLINVVEDTSPTLGGDLDADQKDIDDVNKLTVDSLIMTNPTAWLDQFKRTPFYYTECWGQNAQHSSPWLAFALSSGAITTINGTTNHPGAFKITSSTTTGSGGYVVLPTASLAGLTGGEQWEGIVYFVQFDSTTSYLGFIDVVTTSESVDGAYFSVDMEGAVMGKTSNGSSRSETEKYNLSLSTWYRFKVVMTSAARVDYYIYNDAGTELFNDNLTTNIPSAANTGNGIVSTKTTSGTGGAKDLIWIDYISIYLGNLTR